MLAMGVLGAGGCRNEVPPQPDKIEISCGNEQMGAPGAILEPLTVRVLGPKRLDILGRKLARPPAADVPVTFELEIEKPKKSSAGVGSQSEAPAGTHPVPSSESAPPGDGAPSGDPTASRGPEGATVAAPEPEGEGAREKGRSSPGAVGSAALFDHPVLYGVSGDLAHAEPPRAAGATKIEVRTDAQGLARVGIRLGARNGAFNVEARTAKKDKVRFTVVSGVEREAAPLEGVVGGKVPVRLWLKRLANPTNIDSVVPLVGREVTFRIVGTPTGEKGDVDLRDKRNETDSEGFRETEVTLGDEPGYYHVLAEVRPQAGDDRLPALDFAVLAMDWVQVGIKLMAGILLFVAGVRLLGKGFLLLTSRYAHLPSGPWAHHRFRGYFAGILTGAIFESSSLVNSYLVSLANGGILTVAGALGLVLGANLGGTLLPQVLTLELGWLSAPILGIGVFFALFPRRIGLLSWGWVFLGAGLVLVGWSLLDDAASLSSMSDMFRRQFVGGGVDYTAAFATYAPRFFTCYVLAASISFVLRTSNLVVVVAILLGTHDSMSLSTAVPLVLGANAGCAAMGLVLALGKRREARRLALANLLVHVVGGFGAVLVALPPVGNQSLVAWLLEAVTPGGLLSASPPEIGSYIATAHTLYNLVAGLVFLFFPRALLRLVDRLMPPEPAAPEDVKPFLLDPNLRAVPALALRQATEETIYMTEVCRKTIAEAFDSFRYNDLDLSDQVVRREEVLAGIHRDVSQYLVEVCENQLSRHDATQLETLQTAVGNLARIGSLGERFRDLTARKIEEKVLASEEVERDLNEAYDLVMAQFGNILSLLRERDAKTEENAVKVVERLAKFSSRVEAQWRQRFEQAGSPVSPLALHIQTVIYQEAFDILFRIASGLGHIAERMRILRPSRE